MSNLLPIQIIALGKLLQKRYIQNFLETIIPTNQHLNKLTVSYIVCTSLAYVYRDSVHRYNKNGSYKLLSYSQTKWTYCLLYKA